ncbi:MAG: peptidyl-prolyl cis-trans isomerase [Acidobacteria bacterium]|nr:MAG: peptidyl-prolyl cis-trans isomerase [Acidobacteriota bacterium]REJ99479.1 MAG: peptidyl-prolyl cis-trans isomerase [Acidobacteriota bacterium]
MTSETSPEQNSTPRKRRFRLLRDPFVVFLLIGAGLFALDAWRGGGEVDRDIVVSRAEMARLAGLWEAQSGRAPTPEELAGLVEATVREEVLFREALRLGLDQDDTIIRRRLAQKMGFLLDDTTRLEDPDEAALRRWFEGRAERWAEPPRWSFRHVYFSVDRRGEQQAQADATGVLERLRSASPPAWRSLGDPFMLQREYAERTAQDVGELFGRRFADALATSGEGADAEWFGPVRSALGLHLVQVVATSPPRQRGFEEVRAQVLEEWRRERRREANEQAYRDLRARYEVEIEPLVDPGDDSEAVRDDGGDGAAAAAGGRAP